jgi:hypothetical protein
MQRTQQILKLSCGTVPFIARNWLGAAAPKVQAWQDLIMQSGSHAPNAKKFLVSEKLNLLVDFEEAGGLTEMHFPTS